MFGGSFSRGICPSCTDRTMKSSPEEGPGSQCQWLQTGPLKTAQPLLCDPGKINVPLWVYSLPTIK